MKKKVLVGYIIAAMIALVAFEYAFWTNGFSYLEHQSEKSYLTQAEMLRDLFQAEDVAGENGYEQFAENYAKAYNIRITIIDSEGNVLGESQGASDLMSNHLNREEVQKALEGQSNSLIRKSDTFDVDYCYCAVPVDCGDFHGVMRVALPLSELKNMDNEFVRSTVLVTLVLLVVVFFLGAYFRKYVQAMKKVENMRREFVSNVTHELKTPLTSIRGFVETLKDGAIEDPKMAHRFLDIIDIETERLSHLISDTLLLSEIESKQDANREPCDVNAVIAEVVELLQPKVREHVRLIFQPDPTLKPYNCNRDRLKQLLINLVDNGLKATEFGAVTVRCRTMGNELVLEISDTGIGMEEEQLERIFERFYRVDKGRSKAQGGTGLGLSIVKHIVELYHGTVHVTSKPGVGTEFTVKLPY
ncbi:GHKL domain-containing protein [Anaerosacchariphilus sp. NSJ-68]|uniref:histidine kinase n=2 Tax=Lachnospiraceae TaxID=186803 RepID=A0A923RLD1_9FIRM|nr:GHKL domain-containing protein [Anaerosacchariphilus hominis]MBC5698567.1 GHKL domain-containing protein [Roseburia difficilis]